MLLIPQTRRDINQGRSGHRYVQQQSNQCLFESIIIIATKARKTESASIGAAGGGKGPVDVRQHRLLVNNSCASMLSRDETLNPFLLFLDLTPLDSLLQK